MVVSEVVVDIKDACIAVEGIVIGEVAKGGVESEVISMVIAEEECEGKDGWKIRSVSSLCA